MATKNRLKSGLDRLRFAGLTDARPSRQVGPAGGVRTVGLSLVSLITLRWIAVAGQSGALVSVRFAFDFPVLFLPCLSVVVGLAVSNLMLMLTQSRRLTERRASVILTFDLLQLTLLLGLTGGLENPFAILLLAPVTVSATILSRRAIMGLTALAVLCCTAIAFFSLPLPWKGPGGLNLPVIYQLGIWTALTMSLAFLAAFIWTASEDSRRMTEALSESADALAREREVSALGALAAAAAHELGSPLATIAVVSKDLLKVVPEDSPLREDIELVKSQSDRCREILVGLSRQPGGSADDPFETLPLSDLVELSTDEHVPDNIELEIEFDESCEGPEPFVRRTPEFLNGIGNFASNAGQFAREKVTIRLFWTDKNVWLVIHDDGPGFSPSVMQMLGEPYMSTRAGRDGHMGLGVFIATTLLERIGGETSFRNRKGAEILVHWERDALEAAPNRL